jgi:hypothetical protein
VGSKAFGGLNRRLKEKTAESRWFETTGQAPFGRAKAAYWKITHGEINRPHRLTIFGRVDVADAQQAADAARGGAAGVACSRQQEVA